MINLDELQGVVSWWICSLLACIQVETSDLNLFVGRILVSKIIVCQVR
jgi:hypothetical protein